MPVLLNELLWTAYVVHRENGAKCEVSGVWRQLFGFEMNIEMVDKNEKLYSEHQSKSIYLPRYLSLEHT